MMRIPDCMNPQHPADTKRQMSILQETDTFALFACVPCRDLHKALSVRYVTLPKGWAKAEYINRLRGVEKIRDIERFKTKINYSSPILTPYTEDKLEIISFIDRGEYFEIHFALNGVRAVPIDLHKSDYDRFRKLDRQQGKEVDYYMKYWLRRQGKTLIEMFGDAREPKPVSAMVN